MMKFVLNGLLMVFGLPLFGQLYNEDMHFQPEIDSVVIRAAKDGVKKLEITVTPWTIDKTTPLIPGEKPQLKWIAPQENDPDSRIKAETITWTILNDSLVKQERENHTCYAIIRNGHLYEYNRRKKQLAHPKHYSEKDSAGMLVTTVMLRPGYGSRRVYDSSGRLVETYQHRAGQPVWYTHISYPGDSTRMLHSYYLNPPDTLVTKVFTSVRSQDTNFYYRDTVMRRLTNDTMPLVSETYIRWTINPDRTFMSDTIIIATTSLYGEYKPFKSVYISNTRYVYDNEGRLVGAEELDYSSNLGPYWKTQLAILYIE